MAPSLKSRFDDADRPCAARGDVAGAQDHDWRQGAEPGTEDYLVADAQPSEVARWGEDPVRADDEDVGALGDDCVVHSAGGLHLHKVELDLFAGTLREHFLYRCPTATRQRADTIGCGDALCEQDFHPLGQGDKRHVAQLCLDGSCQR